MCTAILAFGFLAAFLYSFGPSALARIDPAVLSRNDPGQVEVLGWSKAGGEGTMAGHDGQEASLSGMRAMVPSGREGERPAADLFAG